MREKLNKWNFSAAQFLFLISLYITLLCEIIVSLIDI